jgi:hypothetical protein
MAWSTGNLGVNAPGNLIALLNVKLLENAHWSIYDANAADGVAPAADFITNGDFATNALPPWTSASGWSAATGKAVHGTGNTSTLVQTISSLANKNGLVVEITFTMAGNAGVIVSLTNATFISITGGTTTITAAGTYTGRWQLNSATAPVITFNPSPSTFTGSIDNVVGSIPYANTTVYRCYDATENCDFYVRVDDNHYGLSVIELWEGWDAVTHVGIGASLKSVGTSLFLQMTYGAGGYGISVRDHCFVWKDYVGNNGAFVGQPERYDTSKNIVVYCGPGMTPGINALGIPGAVVANAWGTLFDEVGNKVSVGFSGSGGGATNGVKTIGGEVVLAENELTNITTSMVLGRMSGVASYGAAASAGIITGDTVVIDGVTWEACFSTNLSFIKQA